MGCLEGEANFTYNQFVELLNVMLMAKHSEIVGDGRRSPRNFYEQLLRLTGETPLNVLSTINNRFSIDAANPQVHSALEREFLSDKVKSKLARAVAAMTMWWLPSHEWAR